jgi:1-acyl-sn-glycerol-3-phosphate acyltransferase
MRAVKRASRCLKRGESVLVFPEGTRIRSDEQPVEIHGGFAIISRMAKADVQPMAVVGARDIMESGKTPRIFWRVYFGVGERISFDSLQATGRRERTEEMERVGMEQVYALRDALRAEHPDKH